MAKNIHAPPVNKNYRSWSEKYVQKCGRSKNRTFTVVILFFFEGIKAHFALEMNSTKL